ncbi:hypothetical protein [Streptomyces longwoodensis]|uniref:hypothetical protein n=1 Tax=Streptomyces longwoodensis TaxID=68231 RepID=UPI00224F7229|nr:hypothetical protein [Streptomyces longwoodensis]MCX5000902.1 hypothetical protein [Streptomyces longwoodensis]
MTDQPPQPPIPNVPPQPSSQPGQSVEAPAVVAPTERKRLSNRVVIGAAAAVIAAVIGTGIIVVQAVDNDDKAATSSPTASASVEAITDEPAPEPTYYVDLHADSFTITLRTTRKQCFGSAGCNVTVEPNLAYLGESENIDPDATYDITYEIKGDESGPVIGTAQLSDRTTLNYTPSMINTASSGTKVSVRITDIIKRIV